MKLVLLVVHDDDVNNVADALLNEEYHITRLASTGGFLRVGNSLLLCGVEDDRVEPLFEIVRANTEARVLPQMSDWAGDVHVSRAVVFVCNLERCERL
ncbi:MAG: cyclic-di-AMP receptor [Anaerolineae bacterium]|nr:cyclic-di-AMP receptor [Anaerolineae bacterium]